MVGVKNENVVENAVGDSEASPAVQELEAFEDGDTVPESSNEEGSAAVKALGQATERVEEVHKELDTVRRERRKVDAQLGQIKLQSEDLEAGAPVKKPDYSQIRKLQDRSRELKLETADLELKAAILEDVEARAFFPVLNNRERPIIEEIQAKRAEIIKLGGPAIGNAPNLGGEVGELVGKLSLVEQQKVELREQRSAHADVIEDKRQRLAALVRGEDDPGSQIRRDSQGRIIEMPVYSPGAGSNDHADAEGGEAGDESPGRSQATCRLPPVES